jgi:hypothetical protein
VATVVHLFVSIKAETPEFYRLRIGTLDTPLQQKPTQHIFVASQAEWDNICDALLTIC